MKQTTIFKLEVGGGFFFFLSPPKSFNGKTTYLLISQQSLQGLPASGQDCNHFPPLCVPVPQGVVVTSV